MPRTVTSRSSCEGRQVTGNTTVTHSGNEIGVVTGTCSPSGGAKRSTLEERQYSNYLCTDGTCECFPSGRSCFARDNQLTNVCEGSITCEATAYSTIYLSDCEYVFQYLSYYPGNLPNPNSVQTPLFLTTISFGTARRLRCHRTRFLIPRVVLWFLWRFHLEFRCERVQRLLFGNCECHPTHVSPWDGNR
jgi:hypothetical protein